MNFHYIALLLISISQNSTPALRFSNVDCSHPFRGYTKPSSCCYYPFLYIGNTSANFCSPKCAEKHGNPCCIYDCVSNALKLYSNGQFSSENLVKFYENNLNAGWEMPFEKWMPIIKKNVEKCVKIVPQHKHLEEYCTTPYFISQILNCVTKLNFINCPTLINSKACRRLRFFIRKLDVCGEGINGTYFIHRDHFAPPYREEEQSELVSEKREEY